MSLREALRRLLGGELAAFTRPVPPSPPEGVDRIISCSAKIPTRRPEIRATLRGVVGNASDDKYVPAGLLVQKAKSVCDGVFAALEELSTTGDERHMGVNLWLAALRARVPAGAASEWLDAALEIAERGTTGRERARAFLSDPVKSAPVGFYAWTGALTRALRRDRFAQQPLGPREAEAMVEALSKDARLREEYASHLRRIARLTNRRSNTIPSLTGGIAGTSVADASTALYPPSFAPENEFGSLRDFFAAVRRGECNLTPDAASGFYEHQLHALVALLLPDQTPEARARKVDPKYAEALERLCGFAFFLARETHVKQLDLAAPVAAPTPPMLVLPELTVEPVPSFFRATADAFRFLRSVVGDGWGADAFSKPQLRDSGIIARSLAEGIDEVIGLCDAACDLSRLEIAGHGQGSDARALRARLATLLSDDDALVDARGVVPLQTDPVANKVRVAAFLGWEIHELRVAITHIRDLPAAAHLGVESHRLPIPIVRETWVDPELILQRSAWRELCDRLMGEAVESTI